MTTLETLIAARELISVPERWTVRSFARDKHDQGIQPEDSHACKWCILGAIQKVKGAYQPSLRALHDAVGINVGVFNDTHTHAEVLAAFDRAIALERSKTP